MFEGSLSPSFPSERGVRQGENLSPILFAIFLNDLQSTLESDNVQGIDLRESFDDSLWLKLLILLYADDTILMAKTPEDLQAN